MVWKRLGGHLLVLVVADRDVALLESVRHTEGGCHLVAVVIDEDGAVIDSKTRTARSAHPWRPRLAAKRRVLRGANRVVRLWWAAVSSSLSLMLGENNAAVEASMTQRRQVRTVPAS